LPVGLDREIGRISVVSEQRDWSCTRNSRQRRHVQRDLPLKTPQRGSGKSRTISVRSVRAGHWDDYVPAPASASGSGKKDGLGKFRSARLVALTSFGLIAGRCGF
jgi:hypothetical protein